MEREHYDDDDDDYDDLHYYSVAYLDLKFGGGGLNFLINRFTIFDDVTPEDNKTYRTF